MTSYNNGGTPSKGATHRIIVGEGITIEPIDKPRTLPKYPSNTFRE